MPTVYKVEERRDREQRMLVDLNTIKHLTPDRRRGVLALFNFLESPECSPIEERAIFAAIQELMSNSAVAELIDPMETVKAEVQEKVSNFYRHVGDAVRLARNVKRLTQAQLAKRARIPQPHLSRIETGEHVPTQPTLSRLASALGTTVERLACSDAKSVPPAAASRGKPSGGGRRVRRPQPKCQPDDASSVFMAESI